MGLPRFDPSWTPEEKMAILNGAINQLAASKRHVYTIRRAHCPDCGAVIVREYDPQGRLLSVLDADTETPHTCPRPYRQMPQYTFALCECGVEVMRFADGRKVNIIGGQPHRCQRSAPKPEPRHPSKPPASKPDKTNIFDVV